MFDSNNLKKIRETIQICCSLLIGWKVSLSPGQSPCNKFLHKRDIETFLLELASIKKKRQILITINSVMANSRDLFLPSPCRCKALDCRKNLSENIGDFTNFAGCINGAAKSDKEGFNETKKHYENNLEYEGIELKTAILKAHSYRIAQFNEENNLARMEMMDYNNSEYINKGEKMNESVNQYNPQAASNYFSFQFDESDNEADLKLEEQEDSIVDNPQRIFDKY